MWGKVMGNTMTNWLVSRHVKAVCLLGCGVLLGIGSFGFVLSEDADALAATMEAKASEPALVISGFREVPLQTYHMNGSFAEKLGAEQLADPQKRVTVRGFNNRSKLILIELADQGYFFVHRDDVIASDEEALKAHTRKKSRGLVCLARSDNHRQISQPRDTRRAYTKGLSDNPC